MENLFEPSEDCNMGDGLSGSSEDCSQEVREELGNTGVFGGKKHQTNNNKRTHHVVEDQDYR